MLCVPSSATDCRARAVLRGFFENSLAQDESGVLWSLNHGRGCCEVSCWTLSCALYPPPNMNIVTRVIRLRNAVLLMLEPDSHRRGKS